MRQKYVISRDHAKNRLLIREYAIIDKNLNKVEFSALQKGSFTFLCEETYENEVIETVIAKGLNELVSILQTPNIFPIEPYATKIAESVTAMYNSADNNPVELFFDDLDLMAEE